MAISGTTATWTLVVLGLLSISTAARSPVSVPASAPGPALVAADCMSLIYNMSDCLTYVEKGSNSTKPEKACCPELAGMLDNQPICLCKLLVKSSDFPVELDINRALKLPTVCGLKTPPLSLCSTAGPPAGSPTSGDGPSSSSSSGDGLTPSAAGKNGRGSRALGSVSYLLAASAVTLLFAL